MVLKKQTVWLLTMLSLIIVLSVYYTIAPSQTPNDSMAYVDENEQNNDETEGAEVTIEEDEEMNVEELMEEDEIANVPNDELFTAIRLNRDISRSKMLESFTEVIASDVPAEVSAKALEERDSLLALEQKETMLETLIRAKGYEDALVMTQDDQVKVIVKAETLSREEAVEILTSAKEQLGEKNIAVEHQIGN